MSHAGGSGTGFVQQAGQALSAMLKGMLTNDLDATCNLIPLVAGQYDLIGFDPRGVQSSQVRTMQFAIACANCQPALRVVLRDAIRRGSFRGRFGQLHA